MSNTKPISLANRSDLSRLIHDKTTYIDMPSFLYPEGRIPNPSAP